MRSSNQYPMRMKPVTAPQRHFNSWRLTKASAGSPCARGSRRWLVIMVAMVTELIMIMPAAAEKPPMKTSSDSHDLS